MKPCRRCAVEKPLSDFYRHAQMLDGHLNICKDCTKERVRTHRAENVDRIREYDRQRGLLPHRKADVKKRAGEYVHKKAEYQRRYYQANPARGVAHTLVNRAIRDGKLKPKPCERCGYGIGIQAHHEDYSKPLEVVWLCPPCHGERHREINEERRRAS